MMPTWVDMLPCVYKLHLSVITYPAAMLLQLLPPAFSSFPLRIGTTTLLPPAARLTSTSSPCVPMDKHLYWLPNAHKPLLNSPKLCDNITCYYNQSHLGEIAKFQFSVCNRQRCVFVLLSCSFGEDRDHTLPTPTPPPFYLKDVELV